MQTFEHEELIRTHEADAFGLCRPDALFRIMQEAAGEHSALLGLSRADLLTAHNAVWMIARAELRMEHDPKLYDTLHVKTWYGAPGRATYPRYLTFSDASGRRVASFATSWVVADIAQRRILMPAKLQLPFPPAAEIVPPIEEPGKLRLKKTGVAKTCFRAPQYSDLDVNGHMNNASYVSWILDLFPVEYHRQYRLRHFIISYAAEAKPDELVEMTLYREGDAFEVLGVDKNNQHVIFEAQGAFREL